MTIIAIIAATVVGLLTLAWTNFQLGLLLEDYLEAPETSWTMPDRMFSIWHEVVSLPPLLDSFSLLEEELETLGMEFVGLTAVPMKGEVAGIISAPELFPEEIDVEEFTDTIMEWSEAPTEILVEGADESFIPGFINEILSDNVKNLEWCCDTLSPATDPELFLEEEEEPHQEFSVDEMLEEEDLLMFVHAATEVAHAY